ncbi:hypothetical protein HOLleu_16572 [Holothuria leucospilota]|uniref:Uncharacterized protein n=1 Tax=Holothuria leucospilota TaxID=206669 RepID=A0A9Q1C5V5_HOLLE|nr:hypothetical protein HOLleu_16572 [Holothuria leucospilota]
MMRCDVIFTSIVILLSWSLPSSVTEATGQQVDVSWADGHDEGVHDGAADMGRYRLEESRGRIRQLQQLQDKFADVEMMLTDQIGAMKRRLAWKSPSKWSGSCREDFDKTGRKLHQKVDDEEDFRDRGTMYKATSDVGSGALFVRWGNTKCPETAMKVYEGAVGGAWSLKQGEEVTSLCLPNNPAFPTLESDIQPFNGLELDEGVLRSVTHGLPCVVCRVTFRPTVRMRVGDTCESADWTLEYKGVLMSSFGGEEKQNDLICADEENKVKDELQGGIDDTRENKDRGEYQRTCAVCTM